MDMDPLQPAAGFLKREQKGLDQCCCIKSCGVHPLGCCLAIQQPFELFLNDDDVAAKVIAFKIINMF
jgi:hypothetical protein